MDASSVVDATLFIATDLASVGGIHSPDIASLWTLVQPIQELALELTIDEASAQRFKGERR